MAIKIGINGFGRMGRLGLRAGWERDQLEFVHINEIATDAAGSAHLLKYDSVYGIWPYATEAADDKVMVDNTSIAYSSDAHIRNSRWGSAILLSRLLASTIKIPSCLIPILNRV
jgi:glyceraldehyde 3-phosphate dehydrogenase